MFRRASSLTFTLHGDTLVATNFLAQETGPIDSVCFALLAMSSGWISGSALRSTEANFVPNPVGASHVDYLTNLHFLLRRGSDDDLKDQEYSRSWEWGEEAGRYHFAMKNPPYLTPSQTFDWLQNRVETTRQPDLYQTNHRFEQVLNLAKPDATQEPLASMLVRRSYRGFSNDPADSVPLDALRDCLFSGLGIVGFLDPGNSSQLTPAKATPSAGGRNPYEGYVLARNVKGLKPGLYHYSAIENNLALIAGEPSVAIGDLLGGQHWFNNAGAVIFLVAHFERTMWKYPHPTGYRVVLIEAGHIAQNMLTLAAARGLAAAPTCALTDELCESYLGLSPVSQSVVYSVSLGVPGPDPTIADCKLVALNPVFRTTEGSS